MKTILQSLLRFKSSTLLNIIGLSTAFAAFIVIAMQLKYDMEYNRYHENYDSVYMLTQGFAGHGGHIFSRPDATAIQDDLTLAEYTSVHGKRASTHITLMGGNGEEDRFISGIVGTGDANLTKIFTFDFIEGDENAIASIDNIIVSDRFAKKWYGDKSPIGETVKTSGQLYKIAAVYRSLPESNTLRRDMYCNIGDENINNPRNTNYQIFIKVHDGVSRGDLDAGVEEVMNGAEHRTNYNQEYKSSVVSLSGVRYEYEGYNRGFVILLFSLAFAIIALASINFINFAISMVPLKIKGINIRKIVGASQTELRVNVVGESLTLSLLSFVAALGLVELFKSTSLNNLLHDSSLETNYIVYIIALGVAVLAGVISGLYPAFYSTSFPSAMVLKRNYTLNVRGVNFKKILIGFQFFVTLCAIIGAIVIQLQYDFMTNRDGGYIKEGVVAVYQHGGLAYDKAEVLQNELLKSPQIKDITFADFSFGVTESPMTWGRGYSKGSMQIALLPVYHNFLEFFNINIVEGRNFTLNDEFSENGHFIMSKGAMDKYEFTPGEKIEGHREPTDIVGVCENVDATSLKAGSEPFAFYVFGKNSWRNAHLCTYIKVSGNSNEIISHIRESYKKIDPNSVIDISYLSDMFDNLYDDENTTKEIMQILSLITIIISLVGVFGLVSFDTKYRRKEISLRKINGATVIDILKLFSVSYIKILLISFVIATPFVFVVESLWLVQFVKCIDSTFWIYILALLILVVLTLTISISQTYVYARENPINALKNN